MTDARLEASFGTSCRAGGAVRRLGAYRRADAAPLAITGHHPQAPVSIGDHRPQAAGQDLFAAFADPIIANEKVFEPAQVR